MACGFVWEWEVMAIGKSAMIFMCFAIAVVAMLSIFTIAQHDKSTAAIYSDVNETIAGTTNMTQTLTSTGVGIMIPLILVVAILFFGAVILIFRKKR